jgi:hypothetical protein
MSKRKSKKNHSKKEDWSNQEWVLFEAPTEKILEQLDAMVGLMTAVEREANEKDNAEIKVTYAFLISMCQLIGRAIIKGDTAFEKLKTK